MKDIRSDLSYAIALAPVAIAADTTTVGTNIIDTADYDMGLMVTQFATVTDGTFTPALLENTTSTTVGATAIADANLIGTEATAALTTANTASTIGINNTKRYVLYSLVSASTNTGATVGAIFHKKAEIKAAVSTA